jgi:iron(III) transport system permease protein
MIHPSRRAIERTGHALGVAAYILIVFLPLAVLAWRSAAWLAGGGGGDLLSARRLGLLVRSAGLALAVAAAATLLGTLAALFLWRLPLRRGQRSDGLQAARWLIFLLAPLPPYIHALAWMALTPALGTPDITGPAGSGVVMSAWVQVIAFLPLATALALVGLESVASGLVESARLARPDGQALRGVILPLAAPAILTGSGLVFLLSLTDYSVPSLYQVNTYALEIFSEYSASSLPERAFVLALPLLLLTGLATLLLVGGLRKSMAAAAESGAGAASGRSSHRTGVDFQWPAWLSVLIGAALAAWLAQVGAPLGVLLAQTGSWTAFRRSVMDARTEIGFTLLTAAAAGLLCLPLGLALAGELQRKGLRGWLGWFLVLAPLAVPAPLVGIGLIAVWNQDLPVNIYGTAWMPVLAMLARFSALAALLALAQARRTDGRLFEAAEIFQPGLLKTWLSVRLPLVAPGLLAAAGVVCVLSAGELGATLIVAPPGQATITMRIYNYLHYGASATVAGLGLLMVLACVVTGGAAAVLLGRRRRVEDEL